MGLFILVMRGSLVCDGVARGPRGCAMVDIRRSFDYFLVSGLMSCPACGVIKHAKSWHYTDTRTSTWICHPEDEPRGVGCGALTPVDLWLANAVGVAPW